MGHLHYFILQAFLFSLCKMKFVSSTNVFIFEAEAPKASVKTTYSIKVNLSTSLHVCDVKYLSVALGIQRAVNSFDSPKLQALSAALTPCDLRLGGTAADYMVFDPEGSTEYQAQEHGQETFWDKFDYGYSPPNKTTPQYTMTGKQWDSFMSFLTNVGWDLLFDVNLFFWRSDGLWNSTNAELFLNYSSARGYRIPYFQLGNEPNAFFGNFGFRITPDLLVEDFKILRNVLNQYPLYSSSKLCGPDVTNAVRHGNARFYLSDFIKYGAYDVVDEYSLHHYYLDGRTATALDFMSVGVLDSLKQLFEVTLPMSKASPRPLPFRQTETSSTYGGGTGGLSDRYIAGFMWLDKLGLSAQYGTTRVFRQSIIGASYGLITSRIDPTPDYYLSVLFKRLIEGPVFNISATPFIPKLRLYAHCARRGLYSPGALVVYYLNLEETDNVISISQFQDADLDLYFLTPGDAEGLQSQFVKLNGNTLLMSENTLPPMPPKPFKGDVTVPAQSFGFIVVPHANISLCVEYYAEVDSKLNNEKNMKKCDNA